MKKQKLKAQFLTFGSLFRFFVGDAIMPMNSCQLEEEKKFLLQLITRFGLFSFFNVVLQQGR
jgi:hypothetical protein